MPKYRYEIEVKGYLDIDVTADSEEDAKEKALGFYERYHATTLRGELDSISLNFNLQEE